MTWMYISHPRCRRVHSSCCCAQKRQLFCCFFPPRPPLPVLSVFSSVQCDCRFGGTGCGVCVETGCWSCSVDSSSCCLMLCSLCVLLCCFGAGFCWVFLRVFLPLWVFSSVFFPWWMLGIILLNAVPFLLAPPALVCVVCCMISIDDVFVWRAQQAPYHILSMVMYMACW